MLLSDRSSAIRILEDAKRLNMMDGHFVWLWIDTASSINIRNSIDESENVRETKQQQQQHEDRYKRSSVLDKSDFSDMHVNYLLRNDQFLLFNRNYGVESSKFKDHHLNKAQHHYNTNDNYNVNNNNDQQRQRRYPFLLSGVKNSKIKELPAGLLSLKPLPIKVDKHLVKGAVRLLVSALKVVIKQSPDWLVLSLVNGELKSSCWKNHSAEEHNFSGDFGR